MSFGVKINFRGLLHFVENDPKNKSRFKMAILCPELEGHRGEITIDSSDPISIDGKRVFFKFNRPPGARRKLDFRKGALQGDVRGAVPLDLIAGSTSLSNRIVGLRKPEGVRAQIFLEEGTFGVDETSAVTWDLPADLTGSFQQIKIAEDFFASIQNVDSGVLIVEPIGGGYPSVYPLQAGAGETMELELSYSCEKSDPEFRAELTATNGLFEDMDFRAHYDLLDSDTLAGIDQKLARRRRARPVPRRVIPLPPVDDGDALLTQIDGFGRTGCNCLCSGGGTLAFNVDAAFESARQSAGSGTLEAAGNAGASLESTEKKASVVAVPTQYPEEQLERAYRKALATYSQREDVTGVDIGFRYKDDKRTDQIAVRVHVKEKMPESGLEAAEVLPEMVEGVPLDVIQASYHPHSALASEPVAELVDRTARLDRIQPGVSISHRNVTAGTFGALVYDRRTGRPCILSNWHILVGSASAIPGDPIVQPGRMDGGRSPRDTVARLERMILDQDGDAAIAVLNGAREVRSEQLDTDVVLHQARQPRVGEILEKSGRTTNVTRGKVDGRGQYKLLYPMGVVGIDGFKIVTEVDGNPGDQEVSSGGDSGSLWYGVSDGQGVGLHFGGEIDADPRAEHAVACYLDRVLDRLNISLVPVQPQPGFEETIEPVVSPSEGASELRLLVETTARLARMLEQRFEDSAESASAFPASGDTVVEFRPRT